MDNIEISNMTISDFNNICSSLSSDFDDFWSAEILKSELDNADSIYIVAKKDENIIGFARY